MRRSLFGAVLGTLLVLGFYVGRGFSEPTATTTNAQVPYQPASSLITHVPPAEGGPQSVIVVAPAERVLAVYHVDKTTGEIALRSVRNITWDLQMLEFNSGEPLPQDIRKMRGELQQ